MAEYTNDFKDITDLDPEMSREGQYQILLAAVQRYIFCPITGRVLDVDDAVLIIPSRGPGYVVAGEVWDAQHEDVAQGAAEAGVEIEVYDGRELRS